MDVRRALLSDLADVHASEVQSAHAPWSLEQMHASLSAPTTQAWLARAAPDVCGHLVSTVVAGEAELLTVGVVPTHRRRGVAQALLQAAAEGWLDAGCSAAFLEVRADNVAAANLYTQAGWIPVGARRAYYRDGTDAVLMRWDPAPMSAWKRGS